MVTLLVCWFLWITVQIALIFGARILDYVFNLCEGKFDFLERLSDNLLLNIISYLDLEDIARLSQTSRRFAQVTDNGFVSMRVFSCASSKFVFLPPSLSYFLPSFLIVYCLHSFQQTSVEYFLDYEHCFMHRGSRHEKTLFLPSRNL